MRKKNTATLLNMQGTVVLTMQREQRTAITPTTSTVKHKEGESEKHG
jgi:hypothetical protein